MKKTHIILAVVMITLSWFLAINIIAQVPQKMNYQAIIRNSGNALITNSTIGVKTSILQGSATGTLIYEEVYNPAPETNDNGLVTIEIGGGVAMTGNFPDIDWANGPYFIQTEIDPNGGTSYSITSTSQLMGVPYALFADRAEYGEDDDADPLNEIQTITEAGNVITLSSGGGTVTDDVDDADADPVNEIQTISEAGNVITLSNDGGTVTDDVDDADADPVNEIQTISEAGNVITLSNGGGTVTDDIEDDDADPANELQSLSESGNIITLSNGGGSVTDDIEDADADPVNEIQHLSISGNDLSISSSNTVSLPFLWSQSGDNIYRSNGFVGIGTDNPTSNLHISDPINSTTFMLESGNFTSFRIKSLSSDYSFYGDDYSGSLKLKNNNTNNYNLVVGNDGNIGIGDYVPPSGPLYNFEVLGDINFTGNLYKNGSLFQPGFWADSATSIYYYNGYVGIGNMSPSFRLDVRDAGENTAYFYNSATSGSPEAVRAVMMNKSGEDLNSSAFYGRDYSDNGFGVAGHNYWYGVGVGAWSYSGNLIEAYDGDYPGGYLEFYVDQSGNTWTNGSFNGFKSIQANDGAKHVAMKSIQSPEAWFEDFGSATLSNGKAVVDIDNIFAQVATTSSGYLVFLTPVSEDAVQLFIAQKDIDSFTVKGVFLDGSPANCAFDYRIVAKDAEDKGMRFETVDIPTEVIVPRDSD